MSSKFKDGDKVRVRDDHYETSLRGKIGKVYTNDYYAGTLVEFTGWNEGHDGYEAGPRDGKKNRWFIPDYLLEKVPGVDMTSLKVGDRVKIVKTGPHGNAKGGEIGTVELVSQERVSVSFDKEYPFGHSGHNIWNFWLEPDGTSLDGILELIEPGVVKPFKLGDRVRTICDLPHEPNGEIGTVSEVLANGVTVTFDTWRSGWGFDDSQWFLYLEDVEHYVSPTEDTIVDALTSLILEIAKLVESAAPKPTAPKVSPGAITVLKHLKSRGSISPVEAFSSYGTLRLAARIHELREAGHDIKTEIRADAAGHRYGRYTLA